MRQPFLLSLPLHGQVAGREGGRREGEREWGRGKEEEGWRKESELTDRVFLISLERVAQVELKPVTHNVLLTMQADALPTELP